MKYSLILNNINFEIKNLEDLSTLKTIMDANNLKVNYSQLANELNVDRRTIKKYYEGYEKKKTRNKSSKIDNFKNIIEELLDENSIQRFYSKSILYRYLKDNHNLNVSESSFRRYILNNDKFQKYFSKKKYKDGAKIRFETSLGEQAQIDWKEDMTFITSDGEIIKLNIFVFQLSYSRYRIFHVSLDKKQDVVLDFLTRSFELIQGVPKTILSDNMKTIMDEPRTKDSDGKINNKFNQFLNDFNISLKACMARRPQTKGKVESSMKILKEIYAYQTKINYEQLLKLVEKINNRVNLNIHQGTNNIPLSLLEIEKDSLMPLPNESLRNLYKISSTILKVNSSCMISYKSNQYSLPPEYKNKRVNLIVKNNKLHIYDNTKVITVHNISKNKLNYHKSHYLEIFKNNLPSYDDKKVQILVNENLSKIRGNYGK
ncbi:IS21 family transposase [Helcococcus bovis]|uniref:IS21 family transposase n=2 Tax=Helcococcus bovis TaxID=3153252 RepID=UPI0038BDF296